MSGTADDRLAGLLDREAVRDVIARSAALLDTEDLAGWLALFAADSVYEMTADSPEIKSAMIWWKSTRPELESLLAEVPQHVRDPGRRLHQVTPVSVSVAGETAEAMSHFSVFRTTQEGETAVYAVGRYEDSFVRLDGGWLYTAHRAVLETRMLEMFTHLPL